MKHLLMGITAAVAMAACGPVMAQVPPPGPQQAFVPPPPYALGAPTPRDAYRSGLINRWELERLEGPQPAAMQGPSVDGERGSDGGGGRQ